MIMTRCAINARLRDDVKTLNRREDPSEVFCKSLKYNHRQKYYTSSDISSLQKARSQR